MSTQGTARYRVLERIGSGGMGVVYRAEDTSLRRPVALKFLPGEVSGREESRARFLREARTAASLNHPNIYIIHEVGEVGREARFDLESGSLPFPGGTPYIAMELVEGESLHRLLETKGKLSPERLANIALQIAEGLSEAHAHGIVHRDLKPGNVMVTPHGRVKILDFGLACLSPAPRIEDRGVSEEQTLSDDAARGAGEGGPGGHDADADAGKIVGTLAYLSPEQALGKPVDARSDVFSFGSMLYEMTTGIRPFRGEGATATLAKILESEPPPVSRITPTAPEALEKIIQRCLRKKPEERFEDTRDLVTALKNLCRTLQSGSGPQGALGKDPGRTSGAEEGASEQSAAGPPVGSSPGRATTIAVFPFSVRGSEAFRYLGEGMVDLLGTKLDGAGDLHGVDAHALLGRTFQEDGEEIFTLPRACRLADELGAGMYILGNILEAGGQLHIDATLYDCDGGGNVVAKGAVHGEGSRLFEMVDELTAQILAGQSCGPGSRLARIAALTTSSLPALKAYLEGEREMRAMRRPPAIEAYGRAVAADSGFALAWYRLSVANLWAGEPGPALEAVQQAVRHSDRLSERDRRLLVAFHHVLRGANAEAGRQYRSIVGDYPDDVEAWYQLGELLFHDGPQNGRALSDSEEAWERLLALDPRHANGWVHWGVIQAGKGKTAEVEKATRRVVEISSGGEAGLWMRAVQAYLPDRRPAGRDRGGEAGLEGEAGRRAGIREELRRATDLSVVWVVRILGAYLEQFEPALELAGILTEPVRSPDVRALGHLLRAYLELAGGKWNAARAELEEAEGLGDGSSILHRAGLTAAPHLPVDRREVSRVRDRLKGWAPGDESAPVGTGCWMCPHRGLTRHLREYLLALLAARLREPEVARKHAGTLEAMAAPPDAESLKRDLVRSIEAHLAWYDGDPERVLEILGQTRMETRFDLIFASPFHSQAAERHLRAEALHRVGRDQKALRWYRTFSENSLFDLACLAGSHLRRGEIQERLGRREEALAHYSRAAGLWGSCDPAFLPSRRAAEEGALRLGVLPGPDAGGTGP